MTKAGTVALLVLAWAALPWPAARWAALFAALFLSLGALWSFVVGRLLRVRAADPLLRAFSGRRVEVATVFENLSPLPTGLVSFFDSAGGLEAWGETRRWVRVAPYRRLRFTFAVRGRERGERILGPLTVSGTDPTGLFPFEHVSPTRTLIVYPALRGVTGWPQGGVPSGPRAWEPALSDDPSRLRSYRDFEPGDPLSRLSAAAWARRGRPQVLSFDRTVARPSGVVVDLRLAFYPLRLRWALVEGALETAATLVWDLLGRGETVWLTVLDAGPPPATWGPGRGWGNARPFLERLALAAPDKSEEPGPLPVLPPAPLRLLWVGPRAPGPLPVRGFDVVWFPMEEVRAYGAVAHP